MHRATGAFDIFGGQDTLRLDVPNLAGDTARKRASIEAGDRIDTAATSPQRLLIGIGTNTVRAHDSDPGDDNPPAF